MEKGRLGKSLYSPGYERFLTELRRARAASGLTQVEAAKRLGRPQSFISNCESGERRVDLIEFLVFCRLYGVEPRQIIDVLTADWPTGKPARGKRSPQ
jgi:transcriptional regulator with XRE-family HTH domain